MSENESLPTDMNASPADISIPIGKETWINWDDYQKEKIWREEQERKYWEYHFSGQRTIDMFGVEGAKWVLARQDREDRRLEFRHKSRGKK